MNANKNIKMATYNRRGRLLPVSRYTSRKKWECAVWKTLMLSPHTLDSFITPYERHIFIMRAAVVEGVRKGMSYKEIGDELWCTPQTISAIKKALKEEKYRSYRERGKKERNRNYFSRFRGEPKSEPYYHNNPIPWKGNAHYDASYTHCGV